IGVIAVGAPGGNGGDYYGVPGGSGGDGARIKAQLAVNSGQVLYVNVGGRGSDAFGTAAGAAVFNGGGVGGGAGWGGGAAGSGGGATDLRTCSRTASSCPSAPSTLASRLLVAAGGGGGGGSTDSGSPVPGGDGGAAGALPSGDGDVGAAGSDANSGGWGGAGGTSGAAGSGGAGHNGAASGGGGAGAGGGAGGYSDNPGGGGGGGGGVFGAGGGGGGFSGGGGGAGSSLVPSDGTLSADSTGVPSLTIYYARPEVDADGASAVGQTSATLSGAVNPQAQGTTYEFQYGTTDAYGSSIPTTPADAGDGVADVPVSSGLSGLEPATTYHYRLVATNAVGTSRTADRTFTTAAASPPPDPPVVPASSSLAMKLSAGTKKPRAGKKLTYVIDLSNAGPDAATDLDVTARLPQGQRFLSGSGVCGGNGRTVRCAPDQLAASGTVRLNLKVEATKRGRATVTATATAAESDPASGSLNVRVRGAGR
ncbi:MAG: hypothetical protein U0R24_14660, partial [Solirubrobacterales bacterium]